MKYALLKAWTEEAAGTGLKVESVHSSQEGLRIRFRNRQSLFIYLAKADSYAFFTEDSAAEEAGEKIWDQLANATLQGMQISPNDRIIRFHFESTDIYQQSNLWVLIAELTPPHPNVILARQEQDLVIVDALHKYGYSDNPQRQVLPRLPYQPPQTSFQAQTEEIALPLSLLSRKTGETLLCNTVNDYLRLYHAEVVLAQRSLDLQKSLQAAWSKELRKAQGKLQKQQEELAAADKVLYWQICAETLKHNLQQLSPGQQSLTAINYFDPAMPEIEIPLQPDKSPRQNLQIYLKKYHKAKRGQEIIAQNVAETTLAIEHLANILARIATGEFTELPGKNSLATLGKKLNQLDKLLRLRISEEFEIVIGRKARENDWVTTQLAHAHDWWFHTRIYHGAHVLLRCFKKTDPDAHLIELCCSLAAWYSKAKFSANVPVDYTQIRFVRKPRKSAPGLVTYTNHNTVFATPKDLRSVRAELKL